MESCSYDHTDPYSSKHSLTNNGSVLLFPLSGKDFFNTIGTNPTIAQEDQSVKFGRSELMKHKGRFLATKKTFNIHRPLTLQCLIS